MKGGPVFSLVVDNAFHVGLLKRLKILHFTIVAKILDFTIVAEVYVDSGFNSRASLVNGRLC